MSYLKVIFITSGTTFTLPSDWNPLDNSVEAIGGGGGGGRGQAGGIGANAGGGGGAYAKSVNLNISAGTVVNIQIGQGGPGGSAIPSSGSNGTDTYFNPSAASFPASGQAVGAKGGIGGTSSVGGAGGSAASCYATGIGSTTASGGSAKNRNNATGGGGAGGPHGVGGDGGTAGTSGFGSGGGGGGGGSAGGSGATSGGAGGNNFSGSGGGISGGGAGSNGGGGAGGSSPGSGGDGGAGTEWTATAGGTAGSGGGGGGAGNSSNTGGNGGNGALYGGGGGGSAGGTSSGSTGTAGNGANGIIVLSYNPLATNILSAPSPVISQPHLHAPTVQLFTPISYPVYGYAPPPSQLGFWKQPATLAKHPFTQQTLQRGNITSNLNIFGPTTPIQLGFWKQPPNLLRKPQPFQTGQDNVGNVPKNTPNPVTTSSLGFFTQSIPLQPPPAAPPYQIQVRAWPPLFFGSGGSQLEDATITGVIFETPGTGTSDDIFRRVGMLIPFRWFNSNSPVKDAIVGGISDAFSWAYSWLPYIKQQLRVVSASGPWLDVTAFDYFNTFILRKNGQTDATFRAIIQRELIRERVTRNGMIQAITDLTGRAPIVFEPWNTGDAGALDNGTFAWDVAIGGWGDTILPSQSFLTVFRPGLQGIPQVGGWDTGEVAWDNIGLGAWVDQFEVVGEVTDDDIYRTINITKPTGSVIWTRLE